MSFNSNIYRVDYRKLVRSLVPEQIRTVSVMALLYPLLTCVISLYNRFLDQKDSIVYRLHITPQVCYLEKLLNDRYDKLQRRIRITDPITYDYIYLFTKSENKPVPVFRKSENKPTYLYTRAETAAFGADFIIVIPVAVGFNDKELIALVNSYKLASKTFKVKIV